MALTIEWDNAEQTIILQKFDDGFSAEAFYESIEKNAAMMNTVTHPVDLIVDLTLITPSAGIKSILAAALHTERTIPPNQCMVVIVGASTYVKAILNTVQRIAPKSAQHVRHAETVEAARQMIAATKNAAP